MVAYKLIFPTMSPRNAGTTASIRNEMVVSSVQPGCKNEKQGNRVKVAG